MRISKSNRDSAERVLWQKPVEGDTAIYHIIAWDMDGAGLISHDDARDILNQCGELNTLVKLPDVRESSALLDALKAMAGDRILRQISSTPSETVWALYEQEEAQQLSDSKADTVARIEQQAAVCYIKRGVKPGEPRIIYSSRAIRDEIEPRVVQYQTHYASSDIANSIFSALMPRIGAVKLRSSGGGLWLVPPTGAAMVAALHTFMTIYAAKMDADAHLTDLELVDSERTREDVRWHAHHDLVDQMRGLRTKLADMLRAERAGKVGSETVAAYLAQCDETGQIAALYRDQAQLGLRELNEALDGLRAAFNAVRNGLSVDEYKATLSGVDAIIQQADDTRPHVAQSDESSTSSAAAAAAAAFDSFDPFAQDPDEL